LSDLNQFERVIIRGAMPTGGQLLIETSVVERENSAADSYPERRSGSAFRVWPPRRGAFRPRNPLLLWPGKETVLVVEDQAAARKHAAAALRSFGYRTLCAADAEEVLAICTRNQGTVHMVLTDVVMATKDAC
jgi:hypothetical protein